MERKLVGVEIGAIERIGGPEVGSLAVRIEDLRIELARSVNTAIIESISVPLHLK
jgi:hypothetical protein